MSTAVTDFSFVSSAVGVPFATSISALTVTRCGSATRYVLQFLFGAHHPASVSEGYSHSCSQCLQTDNACGWCIYNKVCSGTPAPCTNETNWYQVSLLYVTFIHVAAANTCTVYGLGYDMYTHLKML